jgi:hypothetical protein
MTRRAFKPTPLAVALQATSLLAVAIGVFGILISDIARQGAEVARVEAPSNVLLLASPFESQRERQVSAP